MSCRPAWLMPVPLPFSVMLVLTAAPLAGAPVQTVIPVNEVSEVPEYLHVPVPPSTVNVPLESNPNVETTLRVPPARLSPPGEAVVLSVPECASRSIEEPLRTAPLTSMLALTPSRVVVMPSTLCPLLWKIALKLIAPVVLTVAPEPTLIADPSTSTEPLNESSVPLSSTLDLPALMMREVMLPRGVESDPEWMVTPNKESENLMPVPPSSLTFSVTNPLGSFRLMTAAGRSVQHSSPGKGLHMAPIVKKLKWVTVAMSWRFDQSSVVGSRTHVPLAASQWNTDRVCACASVVPAGSANVSVAGWSSRWTAEPLARLVALMS